MPRLNVPKYITKRCDRNLHARYGRNAYTEAFELALHEEYVNGLGPKVGEFLRNHRDWVNGLPAKLERIEADVRARAGNPWDPALPAYITRRCQNLHAEYGRNQITEAFELALHREYVDGPQGKIPMKAYVGKFHQRYPGWAEGLPAMLNNLERCVSKYAKSGKKIHKSLGLMAAAPAPAPADSAEEPVDDSDELLFAEGPLFAEDEALTYHRDPYFSQPMPPFGIYGPSAYGAYSPAPGAYGAYGYGAYSPAYGAYGGAYGAYGGAYGYGSPLHAPRHHPSMHHPSPYYGMAAGYGYGAGYGYPYPAALR